MMPEIQIRNGKDVWEELDILFKYISELKVNEAIILPLKDSKYRIERIE